MGKNKKNKPDQAETIHQTGQLPYEAYLNHRSKLSDSHFEQSMEFDRNVLALSSAFIGLLFAFYDNIATQDIIVIFGISIGLFSACILSTMLSFRASQASHREEIKKLDKSYSNPPSPDSKKGDFFNDATIWLNRIATIAFFAGVMCIVILIFMKTTGGYEKMDDVNKYQASSVVSGGESGEKRDGAEVIPAPQPPVNSSSGSSQNKGR